MDKWVLETSLLWTLKSKPQHLWHLQCFTESYDCAILLQESGKITYKGLDSDTFPLKFTLDANPLIPHLKIELCVHSRTKAKEDDPFVKERYTAIFLLSKDGDYKQIIKDCRQPFPYHGLSPEPVRASGKYNFSQHVHRLQSFPISKVRQAATYVPDRWPHDKKDKHEFLTWASGGCVLIDSTQSLSPQAQSAVNAFKTIMQRLTTMKNTRIGVIIHCPQKNFLNSMNRILSLPCPQPPPYWPWLERTDTEENVVGELKLPLSFSKNDFERHEKWITHAFIARPKDWIKSGLEPLPDTSEFHSISAVISFIDTRQYLAHTIGSHTYEFLADRSDLSQWYNGIHHCNIFPDREGSSRHIILLNIAKPKKLGATDLERDADSLASNTESILPEVGERVSIVVDVNKSVGQETWSGHVIRIPGHLLKYGRNTAILATRPPVAGGRILEQFEAEAELFFGHHGRNIGKLRQTICEFILNPPQQHQWWHDLFMTQDVKSVVQRGREPAGSFHSTVLSTCQEKRLNKEQTNAVEQFYRNRLSLIVGPPGTGKSTLIDIILELEERFGSRIWVCTESNKACNVLVNKVCKRKGNNYPDRFYRVKPAFLEVLCQEDERGTWTSSEPSRPHHEGFAAISDFLANVEHTESKMALSVMIEQRIKILEQDQLRNKQLWKTEEEDLKRLRAYRKEITKIRTEFPNLPLALTKSSVRLSPQETEIVEYEQELRVQLIKILRKVQQKLVENAKGIFTTSAATSSFILRTFKPHTLIIDEASQAAEPEVVYPILHALHAGQLRRVLIVGDPNQLPPMIVAQRNPFSLQGKQSLLERLIKANFPSTMLLEQYRMHPDVSSVVNKAIYSGKLRDGPNTSTGPAITWFRKFSEHLAALSKQQLPATHSILISLNRSVDFHWGSQQKGVSHSRFNLQSAFVVARLVWLMVNQGCKPEEILVQAFYLDQVNLIKAIFADIPKYKGTRIATVDGSQGDEELYGIVDCVVLGGGGPETMGFLGRERRRFNVAMSRQMAGRIVIGHEKFVLGKYLEKEHPWEVFNNEAKSKKTILQDTWFHTRDTLWATCDLKKRYEDVKTEYEKMSRTKQLPKHENISSQFSQMAMTSVSRHNEYEQMAFIEATQSNMALARKYLNEANGELHLAINRYFTETGAMDEVEAEEIGLPEAVQDIIHRFGQLS
jgi:hypothetical protein